MKNLLPRSSKGFTLIELLIVIALLSALAVGLLATIDPLEQIRKGRDTTLRNTMQEFFNGNLRYYATKTAFPWGTTVITATTMDTMGSSVTELISAGELKPKFFDLAGTANMAKIYITSSAESLVGCYMPESKAFQEDPNTIFTNAGSTSVPATCKASTSGTAGSSCYYCIQ